MWPNFPRRMRLVQATHGGIFSDFCWINRNQIAIIIFWLIWNQMEFRLGPNELDNGKYNQIMVYWTRTRYYFLLCSHRYARKLTNFQVFLPCTKSNSIWFKIGKKTVPTIIFHSIWNEIEVYFPECNEIVNVAMWFD